MVQLSTNLSFVYTNNFTLQPNCYLQVDLLLNVKKTLGTLSGDGFDPDDLPSFYSHDILFDRPCLPENVLGFISYKQINR